MLRFHHFLKLKKFHLYLRGLKIKIPTRYQRVILKVCWQKFRSQNQYHLHKKTKQAPVFNLKFVKYAVAACIVALLGIALFNLTYHKNTDPIKDLATVSDQDMANYLDSDDIHWTPGISTSSASVDFNENDVHDLLSTVTDDELEQYSAALPEEKRNVN